MSTKVRGEKCPSPTRDAAQVAENLNLEVQCFKTLIRSIGGKAAAIGRNACAPPFAAPVAGGGGASGRLPQLDPLGPVCINVRAVPIPHYSCVGRTRDSRHGLPDGIFSRSGCPSSCTFRCGRSPSVLRRCLFGRQVPGLPSPNAGRLVCQSLLLPTAADRNVEHWAVPV